MIAVVIQPQRTDPNLVGAAVRGLLNAGLLLACSKLTRGNNLATTASIPEVGQAVRIRNRLATVRAVEPYDRRSPQGRLHIVDLEYLDVFRYPETEQLLWEVEATAEPLGKTTLPSIDANRPDSPDALQAFVNAHRWNASPLDSLRHDTVQTGESV
jgi:hypothetical protein